MTGRMAPPLNLLHAAGLLAFLVPGCAKEPQDGGERAATAAEPALTAEQVERSSPSAAAVEAFNAICTEPARNPVAGAAAWRGFAPVPLAALR